jgi:hypothetical protein
MSFEIFERNKGPTAEFWKRSPRFGGLCRCRWQHGWGLACCIWLCFLLNGGAMSWACKKQEIVSLSTMESEYIVATHVDKEALWLRSLLSQIFSPSCDATTLFSDNQSVRGHPSVSLLPLFSPTFYLCICIPPPHLCTISKDRTYNQRPLGPMVRWIPRSQLTDSWRLPASLPARTSTASDGLRTHWDRSAWCYGTLHHHAENHIWEAWY